MDYDFISLKAAGVIVGLLLIAAHALALARPAQTVEALRRFPRSRVAGIVLLTAALAWTFWLWSTTDLGEFYTLRRPIQFLLPVGYYLTLRYVDEFLAVRALGILMLLAACPLLDAAFLRPETSRLLLVVLAYVWIVGGMFFVGAPHLFRDGLDWLRRGGPGRFRAAAVGGLVYGLAVLACAVAVW